MRYSTHHRSKRPLHITWPASLGGDGCQTSNNPLPEMVNIYLNFLCRHEVFHMFPQGKVRESIWQYKVDWKDRAYSKIWLPHICSSRNMWKTSCVQSKIKISTNSIHLRIITCVVTIGNHLGNHNSRFAGQDTTVARLLCRCEPSHKQSTHFKSTKL